MDLATRIEAFLKLGQHLDQLTDEEIEELAQKAVSFNSWFTSENVNLAINGIKFLLQSDELKNWVKPYELSQQQSKKVGVVMAGNIPAVGFHDFLCVLIAGHELHMKLSHQDPFLLTYFADKLKEQHPGFNEKIVITEQLKNVDAMIATGSDNSSRYFDYYFSKYPHIIRKNRTSIAIINKEDSDQRLIDLGQDVFQYFGLGCRNVSKIFVPTNFDFVHLLELWEPYHTVMHHHKYHNNYDYNKSILLVNKSLHLDSGFVLLQESTDLVSPISVLYYEFYDNQEHLEAKLQAYEDKIQCIVGSYHSRHGGIEFGNAQQPSLTDYADNVDTLSFLSSL